MTPLRAATSHNNSNTDTPFVEKDYSGRSIAFAARKIGLLIGGKSNGGVTADVSRNALAKFLLTQTISLTNQ